jgi:bifunctional non-homologous end joining protein LigD
MSKTKGEPLEAGSQTIEITRPDKILFPNDGITKRDLVHYYLRIAPLMLPHLRGHPISMQRHPDGIATKGFFQKNASDYYPEWITTVELAKEGGSVRYVVCDNAETLVYLANQAVITPHIWLSRADKPDYPDQLVFDLDPPEGGFRIVRRAALKLRGLLEERGYETSANTTGSRGLHVRAPLNRRKDFGAVRVIAREIASELVESDPEHLTMEVRKSKREGRVFIDIARNGYGQTAAPPYAVRALDGAPVAAPVKWEEVERGALRPDQFTIRNIFRRLERSEHGSGRISSKAQSENQPRAAGA